jgi:hypothetical protein
VNMITLSYNHQVPPQVRGFPWAPGEYNVRVESIVQKLVDGNRLPLVHKREDAVGETEVLQVRYALVPIGRVDQVGVVDWCRRRKVGVVVGVLKGPQGGRRTSHVECGGGLGISRRRSLEDRKDREKERSRGVKVEKD